MLLKKIFAYVLGDKMCEMVKKKYNLVMIPVPREKHSYQFGVFSFTAYIYSKYYFM